MMKNVVNKIFTDINPTIEKMTPKGRDILQEYQKELDNTDSLLLKSLLGCDITSMRFSMTGYMAAKGASFLDALYAIA